MRSIERKGKRRCLSRASASIKLSSGHDDVLDEDDRAALAKTNVPPRMPKIDDNVLATKYTMPNISPTSYAYRVSRTKKLGQSDRNHPIPKQNSQTTKQLFQMIAPHVEKRTVHQLMRQMTKIISRTEDLTVQTTGAKIRSLQRQLDKLFGVQKAGLATDSEMEYTWSLKGHPWMHNLLLSYFKGLLLDGSNGDSDPESLEEGSESRPSSFDHPTHFPDKNREQFEHNVDILKGAREAALECPIFWSDKSRLEAGFSVRDSSSDSYRHNVDKIAMRHSQKDKRQHQEEAEQMLRVLVANLPPPHLDKLMNRLDNFSALNSDQEETKENNWDIAGESDISSLPQSQHRKDSQRTKKNRLLVLGNTLVDSISPTHAHLIAAQLGDFLYVDVPLKTKSSGNENSPDARSKSDLAYAIRRHRKLSTVEKKYDKLEAAFIAKMQKLQVDFSTMPPPSDELDGGAFGEGTEDDIDYTSDLNAGDFQYEQKKYDPETRLRQREDLENTLEELRLLGVRDQNDDRKMTGRGRQQQSKLHALLVTILVWRIPNKFQGTHLKFTAVTIRDEPAQVADDDDEFEAEEKLVFIDNLPIDISEEEIDAIYSRCGPLSSINLFNVRPDLDPGPLTRRQKEERLLAKKRSKDRVVDFSNKSRPRTPVYGLLRFHTTEGYRMATNQSLLVLGMNIRRHPVFSLRPRRMKTLYIEQIPPDLHQITVEYNLARLLHDNKIYIGLDGMKGVGNSGATSRVNGSGPPGYSFPSSSQIKFEDFKTAWRAYDLLRGSVGDDGRHNVSIFDEGKDCQVHWMKTPADANGYWTRDLEPFA